MQEDMELLRRYASNRSDEDFTRLARRHLNLVYFSALRRTNGNVHLAEDVTQLVFIALAREASSLQRHTVLAGWLYVATRNAAAQAMRTEQRRITREQEAFAMQESSSSPIQETDWDRIRPQLDIVLDQLNEQDRDAVLLRYFQNRPFAEIGGTLQISDDAARMRVDRALEKLRTLLARRGITSTTAALAIALENQAAAAVPAGLAAAVNNGVRASGAVGAATAALPGTFQFMSTTTITIGVSGLVSILAVGSALYQASQARQAEASLASASKASAERIHDLQARLATTEKSRAAAEQSVQTGKAAMSEPAPATEGMRKQKKAAPTVSFGESMKDPVYAEAWRKQQRRNFENVFGDAFTALNLPPDKLVRLKELLLARREATGDAADAARTAGLTPVELREAVKQASSVWTNEIKGLVGENGYALLDRSEKAFPMKPIVESAFVVDLKAAGIPPSAEQFTNLALERFK